MSTQTMQPFAQGDVSRAQDMVSPQDLNALMLMSTLILLAALGIGYMLAMSTTTPNDIFTQPSAVLAVGLALALWVEGSVGMRNLIRVDLFMLMVLYLLTFFEFLLPQDPVRNVVTTGSAQLTVEIVILGFAGIVIGRHLAPVRRAMPRQVTLYSAPGATILMLLACAVLGYFYMLLTVNFSLSELLFHMSRERFSQPWSRGQLGSLGALLGELALLKFLIPPLAAAVLAQWRRYRLWQLVLTGLILYLVLFESFASGTRNVFLSHMMTFLAAYALLSPKLTFAKAAAVFGPALIIGYFAIYYLPEIRTVGLRNFELAEATSDSFFVDMNLVNIAQLTDIFPEQHPFLGAEIPYTAAIRPIPRGLWPGKPEGLSLGIEEALGVTGMTLSATFVGELWMAGGTLAVGLAALILGAVAGWWNRKALRARSNMDMILYATGFFPAGLCMRSFLSVAPALLPLIAFVIYRNIRFSLR
ncbi:hypothetical protein SAMN05428995_10861 [Loktanella sp. DSM 29012]|uniref:hypothetical protein n=1 Tax=Loktanella sp. DSM 29012 TaxID=1881056 RepID=UPI0008B2EBEC|nr:hypothetical protein [Loktanella sp. DSM 29012]SEQ78455.1 hypothetical protein SAMN05428995_10861 [Loktanella sp. DSM 29012]